MARADELQGEIRALARQRDALILAHNSGIEIEATGGIDLANARHYSEAGVDFVSAGALTHSVHALDIALEVSGSTRPAAE